MIRWHIKFTISEFHLIFTLILGSHLAMMTFHSRHAEYIALIKKEQEKKKVAKDVNAEDDLEENAGGVRERFRRKPFVITYVGDIKKRQYSELLSILTTKQKLSGPSYSSSPLVKKAQVEEVSGPLQERPDFKITDVQKKNLIKRLIKEKLTGVEVCKRKYLLEDEFLMGTITVNMKIKGKDNFAIPKFQGHGSSSVIQSLETCIKGELAALNFPQELSNEEVTFDLKVN